MISKARGQCKLPPAPGFRDAGNNSGYGALREVGHYGYSWSLSTTGANASYLVFHTGGVYPQYSTHRAYGFPLRCLQE